VFGKQDALLNNSIKLICQKMKEIFDRGFITLATFRVL